MKKWLGLAIAGAIVAGCAKSPSGGSLGNTRVRITMKVAGKIKPNYVYVVAIRWAKNLQPFDGDRGPIPVIGAPWGNGIVAGRANIFVRWDSFQVPNYQIYRFTDAIPDDQFPQNGASYLTQYIPVGIPIDYTDVQGGDTLDFELDLSQIAASTSDIPLLKSLQINLLTMDRVPTGNDSGGKHYDALGNTRLPSGIDDFITIPLDRSDTYTNQTKPVPSLEPTGDVDDPDLDIRDWTVKVSLP